MILQFIVIEDTNIREDRNHVKLQWFLLTIGGLAEHIVVKFHLELFSEKQFYIFLTLLKLREN